jgi:hypothetical protein
VPYRKNGDIRASIIEHSNWYVGTCTHNNYRGCTGASITYHFKVHRELDPGSL